MTVASAFASRTLAALELVATGPVSAADVASALEVDPRTARALLNRLAVDGFLLRRSRRNGRYCAGPRLHALAVEVLLRHDAPELPHS